MTTAHCKIELFFDRQEKDDIGRSIIRLFSSGKWPDAAVLAVVANDNSGDKEQRRAWIEGDADAFIDLTRDDLIVLQKAIGHYLDLQDGVISDDNR